MNVYRWLVPLSLGVAAGAANFLALRGSTVPLELVAIRSDVAIGDLVTEDKLIRVPVRIESSKLLAGLIDFNSRGTYLECQFRRRMKAGDLLFKDDVVDPSAEIRSDLDPNERQETLIVRDDLLAYGLSPNDWVEVYYHDKPPNAGRPDAQGAMPKAKPYGPFRFLGAVRYRSANQNEQVPLWKVVISAPKDDQQIGSIGSRGSNSVGSRIQVERAARPSVAPVKANVGTDAERDATASSPGS